MVPENVIYLNDNCLQKLMVCKFLFAHPEFYGLGNLITKRGNEIAKHWKLIRKNTDVLITHGPPFGKLDTNAINTTKQAVKFAQSGRKLKPKYHIFDTYTKRFSDLQRTHHIHQCLFLDERYRIKTHLFV